MDKNVAEAMAIIAKKVMINGHERVYTPEEERLEEALETVEDALGLAPNFELHSGDVWSGGYIDKEVSFDELDEAHQWAFVEK